MTVVYYSAFRDRFPSAIFNDYLKKVPRSINERIQKFRHWRDAHSCLFGKLLLLEGLSDSKIHLSLSDIQYNSFNRPYFEHDNIDFNISHSGEYVVCAISNDGRVGIDIERVADIDIDGFEGQFDGHEWDDILKSPNRSECFFDYWTKKEAGVKIDGRGLNVPLKNVIVKANQVYVNDVPYFVNCLSIDELYKAHLAHNQLMEEIQLRQVHF